MKNSLIIIGGLIIILLPGGLTLMIAWAIIFPKHRKSIFNFIKKMKGDLMAMATIIGKQTDNDQQYVSKLDLTSIDETRIESADKAFAYVEAKHQERMTTFTPALMVGMFGIGAALIATLWVLSSIFPV